LPDGVDEKRFTRRRSMLDAVDNHFRTLEKSDALVVQGGTVEQRRPACGDGGGKERSQRER